MTGEMAGLIGLMVMVPVALILLCVTTYLVMRRRVEVSRRHRAGVPLRWAVSPAPHARLHWRLRCVVAALRVAVPVRRGRAEVTWISEQADEIETLAASAARELVVTAHLDRRARRLARDRISPRTAHLERLTAQLVELSAELDDRRVADRSFQERVTRVAERLEAMRAAVEEVRLIDDGDTERFGQSTAEPDRATATAFEPR